MQVIRHQLRRTGVLQGMKACAGERWGPGFPRRTAGRRSGPGERLGWHLTELLQQAGAGVIGSDVNHEQRTLAQKKLGIHTVDPEDIYDVPVDIFAPCAMGGAISESTLPRLTCEVIAGSANNQIDGKAVAGLILQRGIYRTRPTTSSTPGGLDQRVCRAARLRSEACSDIQTREIYGRLRNVFKVARDFDIPTSVAADRMVERRLTEERRRKIMTNGIDSAALTRRDSAQAVNHRAGEVRLAMKRAHLALVSLTEPHDETACDEIHNLKTDKHDVSNHRRVDQEQQ